MTADPDDLLDTTPEDGLREGTLFGRYKILRCIGAGGMGAVYEAEHTDLGKRVALKTLHAKFSKDPMVRARFLREGQAASRIRHPHVVDVSDYGSEAGVLFLVMEFLHGESLGERIERAGPIAPMELAEIMVPVCVAVGVLHQQGIIHRDLKPDNIFLTTNAYGAVHPKVLDFGISKLTDTQAQDLTGTGALLGTVHYMSPEQVQGARKVDASADQYSLGVILYEALTARLPFDRDVLFELMMVITQGLKDPPRALVPTIPEALDAVVLKAMSLAITDRFDSVYSLGRALLAFTSPQTQGLWAPVLGMPTFLAPRTFRVSAPPMSAPPAAAQPSVAPPSVTPLAALRPRYAVFAALLLCASLAVLVFRVRRSNAPEHTVSLRVPIAQPTPLPEALQPTPIRPPAAPIAQPLATPLTVTPPAVRPADEPPTHGRRHSHHTTESDQPRAPAPPNGTERCPEGERWVMNLGCVRAR